jgi:catechol 2,3-dioxygenase-like lactoylglutathione lyase family enzyme
VDRPDASITFLTYEDLESGIRFYGETLGLPLIEDQGWAKIYRISGSAYVGLVSARGRAPEKPVGSGVLLSIVLVDVEDVDAWYERLRDETDIEITSGPAMIHGIPVYSFFLHDPAGYRVEIQAFTDHGMAEQFGRS